MPGLFITFEGGEGAGKSSHIRRLAATLEAEGHDVLVTREPGGSAGAEAVRHVVLSGAAEPYGPAMEAVLFAAARQDHIAATIRPALEAGRIVLCDRFADSTRAYQGGNGRLAPEFLSQLESVSLAGLKPDLTILLDIPAEIGLGRAGKRRAGGDADRFEKDDVAVHESRRKLFLDLAEAEPERIRVVDANRPVETVAQDIRDKVEAVIRERSARTADV